MSSFGVSRDIYVFGDSEDRASLSRMSIAASNRKEMNIQVNYAWGRRLRQFSHMKKKKQEPNSIIAKCRCTVLF